MQFLQAAYMQRLRAIVVAEEILSASEPIGKDKAPAEAGAGQDHRRVGGFRAILGVLNLGSD